MRSSTLPIWIALSVPLLALFLFLASRLRAWLVRRGASARTLRWLDALTRAAVVIVRQLDRTMVADYKDPAKPGAWDEEAKRAVKDLAMQQLRSAVAAELSQMRASQVAPERIETLIDASIEGAVATTKSSAAFLEEMRRRGAEDEGTRVVAADVSERVARAMRRSAN